MSHAVAQIARVGPVEVDTGSPYIDIAGVIVICLALAIGFRLIRRWLG
jgi:hypothetical protein